ncbi:MAG: hypothetical protein AAF368_06010, partial [Planctomycetota bacterium]
RVIVFDRDAGVVDYVHRSGHVDVLTDGGERLEEVAPRFVRSLPELKAHAQVLVEQDGRLASGRVLYVHRDGSADVELASGSIRRRMDPASLQAPFRHGDRVLASFRHGQKPSPATVERVLPRAEGLEVRLDHSHRSRRVALDQVRRLPPEMPDDEDGRTEQPERKDGGGFWRRWRQRPSEEEECVTDVRKDAKSEAMEEARDGRTAALEEVVSVVLCFCEKRGFALDVSLFRTDEALSVPRRYPRSKFTSLAHFVRVIENMGGEVDEAAGEAIIETLVPPEALSGTDGDPHVLPVDLPAFLALCRPRGARPKIASFLRQASLQLKQARHSSQLAEGSSEPLRKAKPPAIFGRRRGTKEEQEEADSQLERNPQDSAEDSSDSGSARLRSAVPSPLIRPAFAEAAGRLLLETPACERLLQLFWDHRAELRSGEGDSWLLFGMKLPVLRDALVENFPPIAENFDDEDVDDFLRIADVSRQGWVPLHGLLALMLRCSGADASQLYLSVTPDGRRNYTSRTLRSRGNGPRPLAEASVLTALQQLPIVDEAELPQVRVSKSRLRKFLRGLAPGSDGELLDLFAVASRKSSRYDWPVVATWLVAGQNPGETLARFAHQKKLLLDRGVGVIDRFLQLTSAPHLRGKARALSVTQFAKALEKTGFLLLPGDVVCLFQLLVEGEGKERKKRKKGGKKT